MVPAAGPGGSVQHFAERGARRLLRPSSGPPQTTLATTRRATHCGPETSRRPATRRHKGPAPDRCPTSPHPRRLNRRLLFAWPTFLLCLLPPPSEIWACHSKLRLSSAPGVGYQVTRVAVGGRQAPRIWTQAWLRRLVSRLSSCNIP